MFKKIQSPHLVNIFNFCLCTFFASDHTLNVGSCDGNAFLCFSSFPKANTGTVAEFRSL